jgi:hypothetical protein
LPQSLLQVQATQQWLEGDQTGKRGELLILEANLWQHPGFRMHSGFAKLHTDGLSRLCGLNSQTNYTNIEAVSLTAAARISAFSQLSPRVKLGKSAATLHQPTNTGSEAPKSSFLCNWRV